MTSILRILLVTILALAARPLWAAFVANPSFEDNYNSTYPSYGSIDSWTGGSGVNQTNGPFHDVGTLIPDRDRVAFIQGGTTMSQTISGLTPGKQYWLQFWYEGRNCCGGTMQLLVSFGGVPIGAIASIQTVTSGYNFANLFFTPTSDTGTLAFQTVVSGDATVDLDAVNIVQRDAGNVVMMNPSFEASGPPTATTGNPPAADSGEIIKPAPMAGWQWDTTKSGTYGISLAGGEYADNGAIPDQDLVGFIAGPGSLSQTVSGLFVNTTYQLSFAYNAQSAAGTDAHLQVKAAGNVVDDEDVAPVGGANPYHTNTVTFTATSTRASISFAQTNANGTLLLDDVRLVGQVLAGSLAFAPASLELAATRVAQVQVTVPPAFLAASAAQVSLSPLNPAVARIVNASSSGVLTLHFPQGTNNVQTFQILGLARGTTSVAVTATAGLAVVELPTVEVFTSFVLNPSFEDSATNASTITCWTGGSGVNDANGPALDNGIIPDRDQVAVLAGTNTLSQQIYGLAPGTNYWLQFRYNASTASYTYPAVNLEVKLGGNLLVTITNITAAGFFVGDVPFDFTNILFVPTNASELLEFDTSPAVPGTTPVLLLDAVNIVQRDADEIVIENPSFEASGEGPYPGSVGPALIDGWGITASGWGVNFSPGDAYADNGMTPEQSEVLFLQGSGSASNYISGLTVGRASTLRYSANCRTLPSGGALTYDVVFGDQVLLTGQAITPVGDDNPYLTEYLTFTNDASSAGLMFVTHPVGDETLLLDAIHLAPGLRVPPQLVSESPTPGESSVLRPPLQFVIAQGSYPFDTNTLQLLLNGTNVATGATVTPTNNPPGIVVTYAYRTLPAGTNSVQLILSDKNSPPFTIATAYTFVTLALPALNVSLSAGKVVVAWPVFATGFVLQETSALPGGWTNSAATATIQGPQKVVNVTPTGQPKFYRLAE
jgi:hypothetical protein